MNTAHSLSLVTSSPALSSAAELTVAEFARLPIPMQIILLAEDQDDLRQVMTYFLERSAFRVIACSEADAASDAFHDHPAVDILMTDMDMPGRSGLILARELTALRPSLPVLIVSGGFASDQLLAEVQERGWVYLSKHCPLQLLVETVRGLLASERKARALVPRPPVKDAGPQRLVHEFGA